MFKALTPVIALIIAVALFFTYVRPTLDDIKLVQDETHEYTEALDKAGQLRARIDELRQERNSISVSNLERLEALLPDSVDEVRLLIDLDALAEAHDLSFNSITVATDESGSRTEERTPPVAPTNGDPNTEIDGVPSAAVSNVSDFFTSLDISFTVTGEYNDFKGFLEDLEQTLVLMEIVELDFVAASDASNKGNDVAYNVTIRVFQLNQL